MKTTLKKQVFEIIDPSHSFDKISHAFNTGMLIFIFLNVISVVLETEENLYLQFKDIFYYFEVFSIAVFTIEYILRLWSCTEDNRFKSPVLGRIKFAIQPIVIIDLLAFLPFYFPVIGADLRFVRAVRLFRLFRLFKLGRYSKSLARLAAVIKAKKEELLITLFSGFIVLIIASSLMYYIEREYQPEAFSSIPAAMWWAVATLTTVGYGDVYPITVLGKIIGSFIAVLGVGLFALPAGIIASGFITEIQKKSENAFTCPHCGKDFSKPKEEKTIQNNPHVADA
jgi:voltage-gated potassium channel